MFKLFKRISLIILILMTTSAPAQDINPWTDIRHWILEFHALQDPGDLTLNDTTVIFPDDTLNITFQQPHSRNGESGYPFDAMLPYNEIIRDTIANTADIYAGTVTIDGIVHSNIIVNRNMYLPVPIAFEVFVYVEDNENRQSGFSDPFRFSTALRPVDPPSSVINVNYIIKRLK
jgi:hypothetical protein